jgi:hypothetical protein
MMSPTSMKSEVSAHAFPSVNGGGRGDMSDEAARWKPRLITFFSLRGWRRQLLETLVLLAGVTVLHRWLFGAAIFPSLPHPYLLPVLLVSSQYGISGGLTAAGAASLLYWFASSTPSAAQDFHAYAGTVAVQPAIWLATALVIGGLRSLHIHQFSELADQLATDRQRGYELACGLERAVAEINGLERRIATDMRSVAALSRSLAEIDLSDRRAAAASYAELFRIGTGTPTFTIYLLDPAGYVPVCAVEEDVIRSTHAVAPLSSATIVEMISSDTADWAVEDAAGSQLATRRYVVAVSPCASKSAPLAVIVCKLHPSQEPRQFRRRADELSRVLAMILSVCPDQVEMEPA